jgi:hypothetical protein
MNVRRPASLSTNSSLFVTGEKFVFCQYIFFLPNIAVQDAVSLCSTKAYRPPMQTPVRIRSQFLCVPVVLDGPPVGICHRQTLKSCLFAVIFKHPASPTFRPSVR